MADTPITTTRRLFLSAGSAGAVFGALSAAAIADASELQALIAAYHKAQEAYIAAFEEWERVKNAWLATNRDAFTIPVFIGGGTVSSRNGYEECQKWIADVYLRHREAFKRFEFVAPEQAEQAIRTLKRSEAENLELLDKLFEEVEEHKESFGLTGADRRCHEALEAEEQAALALCSYPCRSLQEARIKAAAIMASPIADDFGKEYAMALTRSFAEASA
jgi:hypothetical protein